MALKPDTNFAGKINPATSAYPYGSARNVTTQDDGTGTPFIDLLINDNFGWQQALLDEAGIVPSGSPDSKTTSQYMQAFKKVLAFSGQLVFNSTADFSTGTLANGVVLSDDEVTYLLDNELTVKTNGFYSGSTTGNATYKFLNAADSAAAGYVDGVSRFQVRSLDVYACLVVENGITNKNTGVDDHTSYKAIYNLNSDISLANQNLLLESPSPTTTHQDFKLTNGRITVEPDASYTIGSAGDINYFGLLGIDDYNVTIRDVKFDGNGQATTTAYNPAGVNVWMIPFATKSGGDRVKYRDLDITNNGGHAVETAQTEMSTTIGITADNHNGIGSTQGSGHVYGLISSKDAHDSHFFLNSANNTLLTGWIGDGTTNGGGSDVAGGDNVLVSSGVSVDSKTAATWILKSPNTGALANRVLVNGLISDNNSQDPSTGGNFLIGDYNNPVETQGSDYFVTSSLINITDTVGTGGSHFNAAVEITQGCDSTTFSNHHICGVIAPSDANIFVDGGSTDSAFVNNICQFGTEYAELAFSAKPQGRGSVWRGNVGARVAPESAYKPTIMVDDDGYWRYTIKHKPTTTAQFDLCDLAYAGGFTRYIVELTVVESGAGGMIQKRICLTGFTGGATTVNENTTVLTYGTTATITIDTTDNAFTRLKITPQTTEILSIALRVIGATAGMDTITMWPTL